MQDPNAAQAAADLRAIREQWGDLLAAIEQRPAAVWPPLDSRALGAEPEPADDGPSIGRLPLVLREHPAPANLDALDAAMAIEEALFEACDAIAERVQRPVRRHLVGRRTADATHVRWAEDQADRDDSARWTLPTHRDAGPADASSPGSRAHGLHWAAMWLEGRALDEAHGDLFTSTPARVVESLAEVARRARRILERALGRDGRPTALDRPCPYCRGPLTAHTRSGNPAAATVVCSTGSACTAPVLLDRGRRVWQGAELVTLYVAMEAAQQRAEDSTA
ncbi:hypothetical protein [Streptomyces sp. NBC_01217]|uniref:hypothetical protein n=1 Tax=Streptomyces sp. NBC_01217 TaxID=2903779 RepID=UPI002E162A51|nr:hypothetical protein OG507_21045 [Streptomyces sp. NBC_01217]